MRERRVGTRKPKILVVLLVIVITFILRSTHAGVVLAATGYQQCAPNSNCVIGEFLYDDTYTPITNAVCTFSSRNPDGSLLVDPAGASLSGSLQNDGWYAYTMNTATLSANATYRSQICCVTGGQNMCLDKTFLVTSSASGTGLDANGVANAVWDATASAHTVSGSFGNNLQTAAPTTAQIWSYSSRSLTSFGSLVSDIWSYSARSLTDFGSLITNIWSSPTRTLSAQNLDNGGTLATLGNVQTATGAAVTSINSHTDSATGSLASAANLATLQTTANTLTTNVGTLTTNLGTVSTNVSSTLAKWGSYSASDIITSLGTINTSLGTNADGCAQTTLFGFSNCAVQKWGSNSSDTLLTATNNVATTAAALRTELSYNGKSTTAYQDMQTLLANLATVTTNVNTVGTAVAGVQSTANTINGNVNTLSTNMTTVLSDLGSLVGNIWSYATRTLTGGGLSNGGSLATTNDIQTATGSAVTAINAHGDSNTSALANSIATLQTTANGINTSANSLLTKWGSYSATDLITHFGTVETAIGATSDGCSSNTLYGLSNCAVQKWGATTGDSIALATNNVATTAAALRNELNYNGKSTTAYQDMQTLISNLNTVSTNVSSVGTAVTGVQTTANTINGNVNTLGTNMTTVLSDLGSMVTNIWSYATRTLTGGGLSNGGNLATINDIQTATGSAVAVINTHTDSTTGSLATAANLATLQSTANTINTNTASTNTTVGTINTNVGTINTNVNALTTNLSALTTTVSNLNANVSTSSAGIGQILAKWGGYSAANIVTSLNSITTNLGTNTDGCSVNSLFGFSNCAVQKWGAATGDSLLLATNNVATTAAALRNELNYNGKSSTAYQDLQTLLTNLSTVSTNLNAVSTNVATVNSTANTINGKADTLATAANLATLQTTANTINTSLGTVGLTVNGVATNVTSLGTQMTTLTTKVNNLATSVSSVGTDVTSLLSNWGSYKMSDVISGLTTVQNTLGTSGDSCLTPTIFGYMSCIGSGGGGGGGGTDPAVLAAATTAANQATAIRAELDFNGKSTTAYQDLQTLKTNVATIQSLIGTSADSSNATSIYGNLKKTQEQISTLNTSGAGLTDLMNKWGSYSATDLYNKISDLSKQIGDVNTISNVSSILDISQTNATNITSLQNSILALNALAATNKALLEQGAKAPIVTSWLENGSVIFKSLLTNPSVISQQVPLKIYLPKEASDKDIMNIDPTLKTAYDPTRDETYVYGQYTLGPNETKIVAVEVTDVWKISDTQIQSLRKQAEQLFAPLKNTPYFAQGTTVSSDLMATLDDAVQVQADAQTPDARIKAYRTALSDVNRAKRDIDTLQTLVTNAGAITPTGILGGKQSASTWSIFLLSLGGIAILGTYNNHLRKKLQIVQGQAAQPQTQAQPNVAVAPTPAQVEAAKPVIAPLQPPVAAKPLTQLEKDLPILEVFEQPKEAIEKASHLISKLFEKPAVPVTVATPAVATAPVVVAAPAKPVVKESPKFTYAYATKPAKKKDKKSAHHQPRPGKQAPLFSLKKKHHLALATGSYLVIVLSIAGSFFTVAKKNNWQSSSLTAMITKKPAQIAEDVTPLAAAVPTKPPTKIPLNLLENQPQVLGATTAIASPGATYVKVVTEGKGIKIHSTAAADSSVVKILHQDQVVQKLGHAANWIHVTFENTKKPGTMITGWISGEFIQAVEAGN